MVYYPAFRLKSEKGQTFLYYLWPFSKKEYFKATLLLKNNNLKKGFTPTDKYKRLFPHQVHGTRILQASPDLCLPLRPEADGVLLDRQNLNVSLNFADCFPVLLSSVYPKPWIMVIHSGYKGTIQNIAGKAAEIILSKYGKKYLERAVAWIGPGIGPCCYLRDLNDPSTIAGRHELPMEVFSTALNGKTSINIGEAIRGQLLEKGMSAGRIFMLHDCTSCNNGIYLSYRRDGTAERMSLIVRLIDDCHNSTFGWENN